MKQHHLATAFVVTGGILALSAALAQTPPTDATPTRVTLPKDVAKTFKQYMTIDVDARKVVQYAFVNPEALAAIKPGEPFPNGTIVVLEDHEIATEAGGAPMKDKDGRFIATGRIKGYAVLEKRAGWGETNPFPPEKDNGDWEFGVFTPDGAPVPLKLDACYACHLPLKDLDFLFTGAKIREAAQR